MRKKKSSNQQFIDFVTEKIAPLGDDGGFVVVSADEKNAIVATVKIVEREIKRRANAGRKKIHANNKERWAFHNKKRGAKKDKNEL